MIDKTVEASEAVANLRREIEELPRETVVTVKYVRETVGEAPEDVQRTVTDVTDVTGGAGDDIQKAGEQAQQAEEDFKDMSESAGDAREHLEELSDEAAGLDEHLDEVRESVGDLKGDLEDTGNVIEKTARDTRDYDAANREAMESARQLGERALEGEEGMNEFVDALDDAVPGLKQFMAENAIAGESLRDLGENADLATIAADAFDRAVTDGDLTIAQTTALLRAALAAYKELGDATSVASVGQYALNESMDATDIKATEQASLLQIVTTAQRNYASMTKELVVAEQAEEAALAATEEELNANAVSTLEMADAQTFANANVIATMNSEREYGTAVSMVQEIQEREQEQLIELSIAYEAEAAAAREAAAATEEQRAQSERLDAEILIEEEAMNRLRESTGDATVTFDQFQTAVEDLHANTDGVTSDMDALADALARQDAGANTARGAYAALTDGFASAADALANYRQGMTMTTEQVHVLNVLLSSLAMGGIPAFNDALRANTESFDDLDTGMRAAVASSDAFLEGTRAATEGERQATEAITLANEAFVLATAESLKLDAALKTQGNSSENVRDAIEGLGIIVNTYAAAEKDAADEGFSLNNIFMLQEGMISDIHGFWSALTAEVQLFGGAMTKIGAPAIISVASTWHLLLDAIIETAGTLIPAAIAFGAFGIAAIGPVETLYQHMTNVDTVSKALNQDVYPLTNNFQALGNAVKPEVYVLFGEALEEAGHSTGEFAELAQSAGHVLDDLGARFVVATTTGDGFSKFVKTATDDLSGWGTVIGNIGGIIGNILKILPGFAEMFLSMGVAVTHFLEVMTGVLGPVLEFAIALHGVILYGGLATTLVVMFGARIVSMATAVWSGVQGLYALGAAFVEEAAATTVFEAAMSALSLVSPVVWVGLAVGALVALGVALDHWGSSATNATKQAQEFGTAMQNAVSNSSIKDFSSQLATAMADTQRELSSVNVQVKALSGNMGDQANATYQASDRFTNDYSPAAAEAAQKMANLKSEQSAYQSDLQQLQGYQSNYNELLKQLDPITGSATASLNGLSQAGVTSQDIMSAGKSQIAEYVVEVEGYDDAVRAATDSTGRYGAAENALAYDNGQAANKLGVLDAAMTTVTQAQTDLINVITGGETSLITFSQGIATLGTDVKASGASMNGLSSNSLQLQSDFYSGVTSLQAMISATEEQGASTKTLSAIVATGAGELLTYAGKNTAAEASIASLINDALGPGTVSLQNMDSWVKKNSTSQQGLASDIAQTTTNASKLAQTLSGDLNAMMAQSITDAYGGQKAFDAFATGVLNGTTNSKQFHDSAKDVVGILLQQSGDNVPKAEAAFQNYAENGLGLSKTDADNLWKDINDNLTPSIDNLKGATDQAKTSTGIFGASLNTAQGAAQTLLNSGFTPLTGGAKTTKGAIDNTSSSLDPLFTNSASQAYNHGSSLKSLLDPGLTGASGQAGASASNLANSHLAPLTKAVQNVNTWVGNTTRSLNNMPKNETTNVHVKGSGGASISSSIAGIAKAIISIAGFAGGGVVPGYSPGRDSVAAMLSPGEGILIPQATRALGGAQGIASINKNYQHFADGGVALPNISGAANAIVKDGASIITQSFQYDLNAAAKQIASKTQAAQNVAAAAVGNLSGSAKAVESLMISMAAAEGWSGSQLQALLSVENREAGFNPNAKNPSSGAYGLAQFINGPSEYAQYGGSVNSVSGQITAMFNYIKQRYGTPGAAWAHEVSAGWYDQGGWLQPGWTMALNNTGQAEKITSPTGSGPGEGGMVHAIFQIDGKSVFEGVQPYALQYNSRNRGNGNIGPAGFAPNR